MNLDYIPTGPTQFRLYIKYSYERYTYVNYRVHYNTLITAHYIKAAINNLNLLIIIDEHTLCYGSSHVNYQLIIDDY